jgi:hypothetical protein
MFNIIKCNRGMKENVFLDFRLFNFFPYYTFILPYSHVMNLSFCKIDSKTPISIFWATAYPLSWSWFLIIAI